MFDKVDSKAQKGGQAGGAGGRTTYQALCAADQAWSNLKNMQARQLQLGLKCTWSAVVQKDWMSQRDVIFSYLHQQWATIQMSG
jgi:hypothetical protein